MADLLKLILCVLASLFKSRATLEAEILVLRQQINVLRRGAPKRPHLNNSDRFLFVWLYRWFPSILSAIAIVRPETIMRWHRAGFRLYWRWRSRNPVGRPKVSAELRRLIREMSRANPLWGAPRVHGELLKLGFEVAQSTVAPLYEALQRLALVLLAALCIAALAGMFLAGRMVGPIQVRSATVRDWQMVPAPSGNARRCAAVDRAIPYRRSGPRGSS
jgi:hypothetical protein